MPRRKECASLLLHEHRVTMSPSELRRREREVRRALEVCTVTSLEVIGDVEFLLGLKSYMQSVVVVSQACHVYALNHKNYERLVVKRYPRSLQLLREMTAAKLFCRLARLQQQQVPLLRTLLFKIDTANGRKKTATSQQAVFEASGKLPPPPPRLAKDTKPYGDVSDRQQHYVIHDSAESLEHVAWKSTPRGKAFVTRRASVTS